MVRTLEQVVENLRVLIRRRRDYEERCPDNKTLSASVSYEIDNAVSLLELTEDELAELVAEVVGVAEEASS